MTQEHKNILQLIIKQKGICRSISCYGNGYYDGTSFNKKECIFVEYCNNNARTPEEFFKKSKFLLFFEMCRNIYD